MKKLYLLCAITGEVLLCGASMAQMMMEEMLVEGEASPPGSPTSIQAWQEWKLPQVSKSSQVVVTERDQHNISSEMLQGSFRKLSLQEPAQMKAQWGHQRGAHLLYHHKGVTGLVNYQQSDWPIPFVDLGGTLADDSDNEQSEYRPRHREGRGGLQYHSDHWHFTGHGMDSFADVYAGTRLNGETRTQGIELSSSYFPTEQYQWTFFGRSQREDFSSQLLELDDVENRQEKFGVVGHWKSMQGEEILLELQQAQLRRDQKAATMAYRRREIGLQLKGRQGWGPFEFQAQVSGRLQDEQAFERHQYRWPHRLQGNVIYSLTPFLTINTRAYYQEESPGPNLIFGDGQLVRANEDLNNQRTFLYSLGPAWEGQGWLGSLSFFQERTKEQISYVAASAAQAKAINLGGVWAQGVVANVSFKGVYQTVELSYTWQEALNDSKLFWQRGFAVPDRPRQEARLNYQVNWRPWRFQAVLQYQAALPLDLTASIWREEQWVFSPSVHFTDQDFFASLEAQDLFAPTLEDAGFENIAGMALIDPGLRAMRFLITLGVYL